MPDTDTTPGELLPRLTELLLRRDIAQGFAMLDRIFPAEFESQTSLSIALLLCVSEWVDVGYRDLAFLSSLKAASSRTAELSVLDYARLQLAGAFRSLAEERPHQAIEAITLVLKLGEEVLHPHLLFLAHFWKGRSHRKLGEYERAMEHITMAQMAAQRAHAPKLEAVTKIHESWLVFQAGERQRAFVLLEEAQAGLRETGHNLSLGNIESARGRFIRRSGNYVGALEHFEAAIALYREKYSSHPNMARALVNAAYVKRLMALDLQVSNARGHARGEVNARSLRLMREALDLLRQASEIYAKHHHQGGSGSVLVNAAHLHLEGGEIDEASTEAERAYQLGQAKEDQILMARARTVQSAVELVKSDEQLGKRPNVAFHANQSVEYADEAIALALHTQNKRLLCEAYIARGMAAASDFLQSWEEAKDFGDRASRLLTHDDRDHLYKQLAELKSRLNTHSRIDERLRQWSEGQLQGKSFQQVQEEFAELVIPRVWTNSGRNVSAVARLLRISPKKVRRILSAAMQREQRN